MWPTVEEVRNSVEGWAAGMSVPGRRDVVCGPGKDFLQSLWCAGSASSCLPSLLLGHLPVWGDIGSCTHINQQCAIYGLSPIITMVAWQLSHRRCIN